MNPNARQVETDRALVDGLPARIFTTRTNATFAAVAGCADVCRVATFEQAIFRWIDADSIRTLVKSIDARSTSSLDAQCLRRAENDLHSRSNGIWRALDH